MGQRLNIEIHYNNMLLANCYMHWSGYTASSINETKQILKWIQANSFTNETRKDLVNYAVEAFRSVGAKIVIEMPDENFPYKKVEQGADRNIGLISITKNDMIATRTWEEGRVTIDIGKKTIDFSVFERYTEKDEIENSKKINPFEISFKEFDKFSEFVNANDFFDFNGIFLKKIE